MPEGAEVGKYNPKIDNKVTCYVRIEDDKNEQQLSNKKLMEPTL
jgi:hypothetical protein